MIVSGGSRKANPYREQPNREESKMAHGPISLRRRHLIMAGLAGIATPAGVFAGQCGGTQGVNAAAAELSAPGGALIVSGRVTGPDCKPLAGAAVEAWQAGDAGLRAHATTDADGRFMLTTTASAGNAVSYRVTHPEHRAFATRHSAGTQPQRDETGTWRTAVGLALA
jgi:Carboxypeptidase regulatory-like domain